MRGTTSFFVATGATLAVFAWAADSAARVPERTTRVSTPRTIERSTIIESSTIREREGASTSGRSFSTRGRNRTVTPAQPVAPQQVAGPAAQPLAQSETQEPVAGPAAPPPAQPGGPAIVARVSWPGTIQEISAEVALPCDRSGRCVAALDTFDGLWFLDYVEGRTPTRTPLSLDGNARGVALVGGVAYVLEASGEQLHLVVVDAGTPTSPRVVSRTAIPETGRSGSVAVKGGALYVASDQLHIYDRSDPFRLRLVATLPLPARADKVVLGDSLAAVQTSKRLLVFDARNPLRPVQILNTSSTSDVATAGNRVFKGTPVSFTVLEFDGGSRTGGYAVPGLSSPLIADAEDSLLIRSTDGSSNVESMIAFNDLNKPDLPLLFTTPKLGGYAHSIGYDGGLLFAADISGSLSILQVPLP